MYKTILVHVDETARSLQRIEAAARLAIEYDAHLIGSAMTGLSAYAFPADALDGGVASIPFPIEGLRAAASRSLDVFDAAARAAGVNVYERRLVDDEAGAGITLQARYCDLVVISQYSPAEFSSRTRSDFAEYVLLNSSRPVLVLPHTGATSAIGKIVTIAWNASAEAVRAITSAIALLQRASRVHLAVFDAPSRSDGEDPGVDIASYLARHGINIDVTSAHASGESGEALLSFAVENGSDLIVMGGFGHSRFQQFLLGGVSRTALQSSPVALWMAH